MDVELDANSEWKTVQYEDASAVVPKNRSRSASFSRKELESLVAIKDKSNDINSSSSEMEDNTFVDCDENTDKSSTPLVPLPSSTQMRAL